MQIRKFEAKKWYENKLHFNRKYWPQKTRENCDKDYHKRPTHPAAKNDCAEAQPEITSTENCWKLLSAEFIATDLLSGPGPRCCCCCCVGFWSTPIHLHLVLEQNQYGWKAHNECAVVYVPAFWKYEKSRKVYGKWVMSGWARSTAPPRNWLPPSLALNQNSKTKAKPPNVKSRPNGKMENLWIVSTI